MKKTLLTLFSFTLIASGAFAQCAVDPAYASAPYGFYPDSTTFLTTGSAEAGVDYDAVIDFKSLVDTAVANPLGGTIQVKLDAFRINGVTGLPAGFSVAEGGASFNSGLGIWENVYGTPGNTATLSAVQGCVSLTAASASVTTAAPVSGYTDYPLVFEVDARIASTNPDVSGFGISNGSWMSDHGSFGITAIGIEDYVIRVHSATTVGIVDRSDLSGVHVFPNPSTGIFNLSLDNLGEDVSVIVFDNQGREVMNQMVFGNAGLVTVDLAAYPVGVYAISVKGSKTNALKKVVLQ